VVDCARAALDGHVVLSRKLASAGHFPAVDILASISRVMNDIISPEHKQLVREGREVLSAYRESADLVEVGAYVAGSNPKVDRALRCMDGLNAVLRQDPEQRFSMSETMSALQQALQVAAPAPGGS
jgi:flagellum-specific ATP synthase